MAIKSLKICCIGDVVARDGRGWLQKCIPQIRERYTADVFIVNAENAAGGAGVTPSIAEEMRSWGVDCITLGDHAFQRKEVVSYLEDNCDFCIRPANYPDGAPGRGYALVKVADGATIAVVNLLGRVFMNSNVDCPFREVDALLANELADVSIKIVDIHAEATSEKIAMAKYLNGRASIVFGTHTHVQTADERILSGGTATITDLGMTGSDNGVIGMDADVALGRFLTSLPNPYKAARGSPILTGVVVEVDTATGKALEIERLLLKS